MPQDATNTWDTTKKEYIKGSLERLDKICTDTGNPIEGIVAAALRVELMTMYDVGFYEGKNFGKNRPVLTACKYCLTGTNIAGKCLACDGTGWIITWEGKNEAETL